jgi:hypothetical protein
MVCREKQAKCEMKQISAGDLWDVNDDLMKAYE